MNFVSGFRLELMYISPISGEASLITMVSSWCAAVIVQRNRFFCLYQKDKSSDSKVKFRQASNCCKRILEAAKIAYTNKTKQSITSQKLCSGDFWPIANSVLNKG